MKRKPWNDEGGVRACETQLAVVDAVVTGTAATFAGIASIHGDNANNSDEFQLTLFQDASTRRDVTLGALGTAAVFGASAVYGYITAAQCRRALAGPQDR
jgi:hypothetical protein